MKILIAESDVMFRQYLRHIAESQPGCQVGGEAGDLHQTLELLARERADLVLVALSLPYRGGLEATRQIKRVLPACRVIVIAEASGEAYEQAALEAGAECLLSRNAEIGAVARAVRGADAGDARRSA